MQKMYPDKTDHDEHELDENEELLSLDSLREAFASVESQPDDQDSGFNWNKPSHIGRKTAQPWEGRTELHLYENSRNDIPDEPEPSADSVFEPVSDENEDEEFDENEPVYVGDEKIELSPVSIFEAMLFVGDKENRPLHNDKAAELMRNVSPEEIDAAAFELNRRYATWNCPYEIVKEEQGYRLTLREDFESVRTKFYGRIKEAKLTQSAIDVLSIVAYKQPITAEEVQAIRKQPSGQILTQLVRRDLLGSTREIKDKHRITYYNTTQRFLRLFGLENIDDLPFSEDVDAG